MLKYENQLRDIGLDIEKKQSYSKKNGRKITKYCNDILVLDIEVTSAWIDENGNIIGYRKGESNEYWNNLQPLSLCYIWQFSFNDKTFYGREFTDFEQVLMDLPNDVQFTIWVHNLSYEFHFLSNFLEWDSVFARTAHKPMKCVPKKYPNIEFRCSYFLTRLSLASWGLQIGYHKAVGDLDYEKLRTPLTPLTDKEMGYCEDDLLVVYHGILEYRKKYGSIRNIPLTQTGTVRRVVKELLMKNRDYAKFIKKLVPSNADEYQLLIDVFAGGYTHANRYYSGQVQAGLIKHFDFASSYPTVMVAEKYPMTPWYYVFKKFFPTDEQMEDYAYIMELKFTHVNCTTFNTYIQSSKCTGSNFKYDNGRVISADELITKVTEQDWLTIRETYKWEKVEILNMWQSRKGYLPKDFVEYILELYHNKTTLKDVPEMEDLYMQSKQYINSMFGMAVTGIVQPEITFDGTEWHTLPLTTESINEKLTKLSKGWSKDKRYFLSFSWGCWVTAYARRNLWRCLIPNDFNVLYCDTDSLFILGDVDFKWYNDDVDNKLRKACEVQGLDFEKTRPKTRKGKEKPLGRFEPEDDCKEFITLGAKRYVERRISDNKLHLTVSGINKEAVALLNDDIDNFTDGFNFDKDADCVHKQLATYITDMPFVKYPDGYVSYYKQGINLRRTGYLLSMTSEYKTLINFSRMTIDDIDESALIKWQSGFNAR